MMTPNVKSPAECGVEEFSKFCELVLSGGEVIQKGLPDRVKSAEALVLLYDGKELIGVAALKNPDPGYRSRVFQKATAGVQDEQYPLELGWVFVIETHRGQGLSQKLVAAALSRAGGRNVFATSWADNQPMHKALTKCGFSKLGRPYKSEKCERSLELFVLGKMSKAQ